MQGRTYFRIMFNNLFVNNALSKAVFALINFCKEQMYYSKKELKFLKKMPLNNTELYNKSENKFIFNSKQASGFFHK